MMGFFRFIMFGVHLESKMLLRRTFGLILSDSFSSDVLMVSAKSCCQIVGRTSLPLKCNFIVSASVLDRFYSRLAW